MQLVSESWVLGFKLSGSKIEFRVWGSKLGVPGTLKPQDALIWGSLESLNVVSTSFQNTGEPREPLMKEYRSFKGSFKGCIGFGV